MTLDMLQYYNMIKGGNINIIYSGPIWTDGLEGIGNTLRKRLEYDEMPLPASQAVFSVFIEQMNNIFHYSAEKHHFGSTDMGKELDVGTGIFILGSEGKEYFIQTGNMMKVQQKVLIKERIDFLNTLDKPGLRKYYKERIRADDDNPESKGAGLGFIEIARRASSKIDYSFTDVDEENTFFSMRVSI